MVTGRRFLSIVMEISKKRIVLNGAIYRATHAAVVLNLVLPLLFVQKFLNLLSNGVEIPTVLWVLTAFVMSGISFSLYVGERYFHWLSRLNTVSRMFLKGGSDGACAPSTFFLDLLLPPRAASTAIDALEGLYQDRWLPRYGARKAKVVFYAQGWGTILSVHWRRIEKALLAVLAALGLDSIIKVFRKP